MPVTLQFEPSTRQVQTVKRPEGRARAPIEIPVLSKYAAAMVKSKRRRPGLGFRLSSPVSRAAGN
jgi:hypothetical protein